MDCRTCGKPMARAIGPIIRAVTAPEAFPWVYPVVGAWIAEDPLAFERFIHPARMYGPPATCPECQLPLQHEDFTFAGPLLTVRCPACGFTETLAKGG